MNVDDDAESTERMDDIAFGTDAPAPASPDDGVEAVEATEAGSAVGAGEVQRTPPAPSPSQPVTDAPLTDAIGSREAEGSIDRQPPDDPPTGGAHAWRPDWNKVAGITGIVAFAIALISFGPELQRQIGYGQNGARVSIEDPEMRDPREHPRATARGSVRSDASLPSYVVNLRNEGKTTATVERVDAKLVAYTQLSFCGVMGGGGDGEIKQSAVARIRLPSFPPPGAHFTARLGERGFQLSPDATDSIGVYFEMSDSGLPDIYALHLDLVDVASGHHQPIGDVITAPRLGFPGAFLPGNVPAMRDMALQNTASNWCYRRNVQELARVLDAAPKAITAPLVQREYVDQLDRDWRTPYTTARARTDALSLMRHAARGGATNDAGRIALAPIAAADAGDPKFAAQIRREAIALLLSRARGQAAQENWLSADALGVLALDPANAEARRYVAGRSGLRRGQPERDLARPGHTGLCCPGHRAADARGSSRDVRLRDRRCRHGWMRARQSAVGGPADARAPA